jgi:hypothetical protein
MGIGHERPVSGSVRITCNSSVAHLDRRATRQYIGLHVDGQSSAERTQTVQQRRDWIHEGFDSRIKHGSLQLGCTIGHYCL